MKLNKQGFLLYEALISLVVLSSFIIFYTSFIQITQRQQQYNGIYFTALMSFRESVYNKYENGSYLEFKEKNFYSQEKEGVYCIIYDEYQGQKEICNK